MADFKYAKGRITESLQFIAVEMREFDQDYALKRWEDYHDDRKLQKLIDRTVENILTALVEVCGTILTQEEIAVESYAQVLSECAGRLGFSKEEQENLAKLAIQRNRLAHRYLNFRWQAISMFKEYRPVITKLLEKILEREEKM
ncbi:MAG: DUF86 domain-containing protein [Candidatus Omnitrophica bacterium]|nr:DUF86 domain-containing protein [Candidatus Omnitrophota bacterium]MBU4479521.1 DUF86 domain-containing protein [Candidatus Omnitrophota bacterium]